MGPRREASSDPRTPPPPLYPCARGYLYELGDRFKRPRTERHHRQRSANGIQHSPIVEEYIEKLERQRSANDIHHSPVVEEYSHNSFAKDYMTRPERQHPANDIRPPTPVIERYDLRESTRARREPESQRRDTVPARTTPPHGYLASKADTEDFTEMARRDLRGQGVGGRK
jgi:hypothetical protein